MYLLVTDTRKHSSKKKVHFTQGKAHTKFFNPIERQLKKNVSTELMQKESEILALVFKSTH